MAIPAAMLEGMEDYHPGLSDLEKMSSHLIGLIQKLPVSAERDAAMKSRSLGCLCQSGNQERQQGHILDLGEAGQGAFMGFPIR